MKHLILKYYCIKLPTWTKRWLKKILVVNSPRIIRILDQKRRGCPHGWSSPPCSLKLKFVLLSHFSFSQREMQIYQWIIGQLCARKSKMNWLKCRLPAFESFVPYICQQKLQSWMGWLRLGHRCTPAATFWW
jgi:hypothetical protein